MLISSYRHVVFHVAWCCVYLRIMMLDNAILFHPPSVLLLIIPVDIYLLGLIDQLSS